MMTQLEKVLELYPLLLETKQEREEFYRMMTDPHASQLFKMWLVDHSGGDWEEANRPATEEELAHIDAYYWHLRLTQEARRSGEPYIWN
jgi:hypothetical protein